MQDPIGNGFANLDARDALYRGIHALEMLNVHGREDIDLGVQQVQNIFVTFAVPAAFHIGVRELIHQRYLRLTCQNGIHIHLFEDSAFVFDLLARDRLQLLRKLGRYFSSMRFNHPNDDVLPTSMPANGLAQHVVSLSHTGCIAKNELEGSRPLLGRGLFQPLFGTLGHFVTFCASSAELSNSATIAA